MTSQKCHPRSGKKTIIVTLDMHKTTFPKWLDDLFGGCYKWVPFYRFPHFDTHSPIDLPIYMRPISYRVWLPRWNQILTQWRFIHKWVVMDIQWMVLITKVKPNINLVEVHPQVSSNGHPVDGVLMSAGLPWP